MQVIEMQEKINIIDKSVQVVTTTDAKAGIVKPLCFFTTDDESKEIINVERLVRKRMPKNRRGLYLYFYM